MEKSIETIYEELNNTINSLPFMDKYRLSKTAFIRNRILNFPMLILYLLNLRKHSNQLELDQFLSRSQAPAWECACRQALLGEYFC